MNRSEFQKRYNEYRTDDKREAEKEAEYVNDLLEDGSVAAVQLPPFGWTLLLDTVWLSLLVTGEIGPENLI